MIWSDDSKPRTREGLGERVIDGEALIVNAEGGEILVLNETGAFIWTLLDGQRDLATIVTAIAAEFETDATTARRDVEAFLSHLAERNALD